MKLITKDFIVDEQELVAYHMLQLFYSTYGRAVPEECEKHLKQALDLLVKDLEKDYSNELDIVDDKLIERITFNEDTLKDLEKNRKKWKRAK